MIAARIRKELPPRRDSRGFTLQLEFEAGPGITAIFGPSGAGKTLTLDCIAGFMTPDRGRILLEDHILFDAVARVNLPPRVRRCGYVFQNYALFPHMSLRANLEFAAQRLRATERRRRVTEALERFHLGEVGGRRPHELSGGQRQRASIARVLLAQPRALLLDEPARGLDAPLRADLYRILREVRAEHDMPILLVTHDLDECLELAGRMLVLTDGKLVQAGEPAAVVAHPADVEVARLFGLYNLLSAEIRALDPGRNSSRLRVGEHEIAGRYYPGRLIGDRIWICIRPDQLHAMPRSGRPQANQLPAELESVVPRPGGVRLQFAGGLAVNAAARDVDGTASVREWVVEFPPDDVTIL